MELLNQWLNVVGQQLVGHGWTLDQAAVFIHFLPLWLLMVFLGTLGMPVVLTFTPGSLHLVVLASKAALWGLVHGHWSALCCLEEWQRSHLHLLPLQFFLHVLGSLLRHRHSHIFLVNSVRVSVETLAGGVSLKTDSGISSSEPRSICFKESHVLFKVFLCLSFLIVPLDLLNQKCFVTGLQLTLLAVVLHGVYTHLLDPILSYSQLEKTRKYTVIL